MKPLRWTLPLSFAFAAVVLAQQPPGKKGFGPGAGGPPSPEVAFRFLDTNHDGKLSPAEFAAAPRLREQPGAAEAAFALLDKNKDGFLSLEEFRGVTALQAGAKQGADQPQFASPKSAIATKPPERAASPEELAFFESKIRPVLAEKCYKCHAAGEGNKVKSASCSTRAKARARVATLVPPSCLET